MLKKISIQTTTHTEMYDITDRVRSIVKQNDVKEGICYVYIPHTTAAVTINENADPDVVKDFTKEINKIVPLEDNYLHFEGNSAAHLKSSIIGFSETIIINNNDLLLGTWQGIYFCEYDGPRKRTIYVKII